jgi:hypothetical protein
MSVRRGRKAAAHVSACGDLAGAARDQRGADPERARRSGHAVDAFEERAGGAGRIVQLMRAERDKAGLRDCDEIARIVGSPEPADMSSPVRSQFATSMQLIVDTR